MSKVDLFVHGQLSKNGYFTCIFGVVHYPMCATSATNVAQNVAQFYLYFKYKCPPATRSRLLGWDPWMDIIENIAN